MIAVYRSPSQATSHAVGLAEVIALRDQCTAAIMGDGQSSDGTYTEDDRGNWHQVRP